MSLYKEDVYETEDPPLPDPNDAEEHFESNEVEKIHIDVQGAQRRFGNCILDSGNADFSDSVATMRLKRGYKASEIFEGDATEEEPFELKYDRVCAEMKQLLAESEKRKLPSAQVSKTDISALNDLLKSMATVDGQEEQSKIMPKLVENGDIPELALSFDETTFSVNRELESNYRGRIVPGTSVQEFSEIIDNLLVEYKRVLDYCSKIISSRHEYINHLNATNKAAQDMKDRKIHQLEQIIEQMQKKQMATVKQEQLRVVKQSSIGIPGADDISNQPNEK